MTFCSFDVLPDCLWDDKIVLHDNVCFGRVTIMINLGIKKVKRQTILTQDQCRVRYDE